MNWSAVRTWLGIADDDPVAVEVDEHAKFKADRMEATLVHTQLACEGLAITNVRLARQLEDTEALCEEAFWVLRKLHVDQPAVRSYLDQWLSRYKDRVR